MGGTVIENIVDALVLDLAMKHIPPENYKIEPVEFKGNFAGQGRRNPPQYGFTISCKNEVTRVRIKNALVHLKHYPNIRPIPVYEPKLPILHEEGRTYPDPAMHIGYSATSENDLIKALNSCVLSRDNKLQEVEAGRGI